MMTNINTDSRPILVTGATGRHGGTGLHVVRRLREEGRAVRALVRARGERSERLEELGAEVVLGDLHDRRSLEPALAGVEAATFTYPVGHGVVEAAASFAAAARAGGERPRIVVNSMAPSHPSSPSPLGRAQWLAEEVLAWAGLDLCVLRIAGFFFENLTLLHGASIRERGEITNCFGDAPVPWIAGLDVAELVVRALLVPDLLVGPVHLPPGAELRSHPDLARELGQLTGREVSYRTISPEAWRDELARQAEHDGVINTGMAAHISALGAALAGGRTPALEPDRATLAGLLGRPPMSFAEFFASHRAELTPAS